MSQTSIITGSNGFVADELHKNQFVLLLGSTLHQPWAVSSIFQQKGHQINTLICPTCGCSLVRLGVGKDKATSYRYTNEDYFFGCPGCVDLFTTDPQKFLWETNDLMVCPTCLAEKPLSAAVKLQIAGQDVYFCRCPYCLEAFQKSPEFYLKRLEGTIPNEGVLDHEGCCVRPE